MYGEGNRVSSRARMNVDVVVHEHACDALLHTNNTNKPQVSQWWRASDTRVVRVSAWAGVLAILAPSGLPCDVFGLNDAISAASRGVNACRSSPTLSSGSEGSINALPCLSARMHRIIVWTLLLAS